MQCLGLETVPLVACVHHPAAGLPMVCNLKYLLSVIKGLRHEQFSLLRAFLASIDSIQLVVGCQQRHYPCCEVLQALLPQMSVTVLELSLLPGARSVLAAMSAALEHSGS